MKILHFSNKPVYPKVDGGCAAMASMISCLQFAGHEVDHICIATEKHPLNKAAYPGTVRLPFSESDSFVPTQVSAAGALLSLLKGRNYNLSRFYSRSFAGKLAGLLRSESYDAVILDSSFLVVYLDTLQEHFRGKIIVRAHNVEFTLWQEQARKAAGLKKIYLENLARSLKKEELSGLEKANEIWCISQEDETVLEKLLTQPLLRTIPFGLEVPAGKADYSSADFMHFGSMNWHPNRESLEFLLKEIWPELEEDVKLHVAGSFSEGVQTDGKNIVQHGFVKDPQEFLQSNGTLLAPLRSGSGIRIKLLEAMAAGVPCVTTRTGAAGIEDPQQHLQLAETKQEWLEAVRKLHTSRNERENLGSKGQEYMRRYHSFEAVTQKIEQALGN